MNNPGIAGSGWTIEIPAIEEDLREYAWGYSYIGSHNTNNEAEYVALIMGIKGVLHLGFKSVLIEGDSQLILHQFQSLWRSREKYSSHYKNLGMSMLRGLQEIKFNHIWRNFNQRADELSKKAMYTKQQDCSRNLIPCKTIALYNSNRIDTQQ